MRFNGAMKNLLGFLSFATFSASALAGTPQQFSVHLKVYTEGKLVSQPRIIVKAGTKGEISEVDKKTGKGQYVEVVAHANPESHDQAFLQIAIGRIESGKKVLIGTPQLSALLGHESAIEIETDGKQVFKVAATVYTSSPAQKTSTKSTNLKNKNSASH
jgi:hypothetical protein